MLQAIEDLHYRRNLAARILAPTRSRTVGVVTWGGRSVRTGQRPAGTRGGGSRVGVPTRDGRRRGDLPRRVPRRGQRAPRASRGGDGRHRPPRDHPAGGVLPGPRHSYCPGRGRHVADTVDGGVRQLRGWPTGDTAPALWGTRRSSTIPVPTGGRSPTLAETGGAPSWNDQMALGLLRALRGGGRQVPEDVSVIGFDDLPESGFFLPPLTTMRQDFAHLGHRVMEVLARRWCGVRGHGHDSATTERPRGGDRTGRRPRHGRGPRVAT